MQLIFSCNYITPEARAAAAVVWVQESMRLEAPLQLRISTSNPLSRKPHVEVGATQAWRITVSNWQSRDWKILFDAAIAKQGSPGKNGKENLVDLQTKSMGRFARLLQVGDYGANSLDCDVLASYTVEETLYLFDPKTGLWKMSIGEAAAFVKHMVTHYADREPTVLLSWVVPVSWARVAGMLAQGEHSVNQSEWDKISHLMCWDAVAYCALVAGVINKSRYDAILKAQQFGRNHFVLAKTTDSKVSNANEMGQAPTGHAICFFKEQADGQKTMFHAMVSTGGGMAAGTKNSCIGIGRVIGWEVLDLRSLNWVNGFVKPGRDTLDVRHRPISDLASRSDQNILLETNGR